MGNNNSNFNNNNNVNNKSAYEAAYNGYNKNINFYNNQISKNDIYNNPNIYKHSNI